MTEKGGVQSVERIFQLIEQLELALVAGEFPPGRALNTDHGSRIPGA